MPEGASTGETDAAVTLGDDGAVLDPGAGADSAQEDVLVAVVANGPVRQLDARLVETSQDDGSVVRVVATVRADVPEGALPEDGQLYVDPVAEEELEEARAAAVEAVERRAAGKVYDSLPLDLSFRDAAGAEIVPEKPVTYHVATDFGDVDADSQAVWLADDGSARLIAKPKVPEPLQLESQEDAAAVGQGAAEESSEEEPADELSFTVANAGSLVVTIASRDQMLETGGGDSFDGASLAAPASAGVPTDSELGVVEVTEADEAYGICLEQLQGLLGDDPYDVLLYDIGIYRGEGELQPQDTVDVSIDLADWAAELIEGARVVHFGAEGPEVVEASREDDLVRFRATGFSVYAIVDVSPEESGQGPTIVPVTSLETLAQDVEAGAEFYVQNQDNNGFRHNFNRDQGIAWGASGDTWRLEPTGVPNQYYIYYIDGTTKKYVRNTGSTGSTGWGPGTDYTILADDETQATATKFNVTSAGNGYFYIQADGTELYYATLYGPNMISLYPMQGDGRSKIKFTPTTMGSAGTSDLNGKTYGIAYHKSEDVAAGLGAEVDKDTGTTTTHSGRLEAQNLEVRPNILNDQGDVLLKSGNSDLVMWTFSYQGNDQYYITTNANGRTQYLTISQNGNLSLSDNPSNDSLITVKSIPNTSKITLMGSGGNYVAYNLGQVGGSSSGNWNDDFRTVSQNVDATYLSLVEKVQDTNDDSLRTFSASKVSISDTASVADGKSVVVYTRVWDDNEKIYDYYVVAPDGSLIPAYERADTIGWHGDGSKDYTWKFIEHVDDGTQQPNGYYDFQSDDDSSSYLAPNGTTVISDDLVGVNLLGREAGAYSSTILTWDPDSYGYKGLKVVDGQLVTCPREEAAPFFVATFEETVPAGQLTPVDTLDNKEHGITLKMVNLKNAQGGSAWGGTNSPFFDSYTYQARKTSPGLFSTNLGPDGYPTAVNKGRSLGDLYNSTDSQYIQERLKEVNHLFYESSYLSGGYYEYDSTQTFAQLNGGSDFKVYRELGTRDSGTWDIAHGQFFPYDTLTTNTNFTNAYASKNILDRYGDPLSDADPRKNEPLHKISANTPDYGFAMEMSASFIQTPDGTDDWGHDSIFEFSGDDDFWLYVDGELVLDIGGVHGAIPGKVNFRTGEVSYGVPGVGETRTNLRDVFWNNYKNRGHSDAEADAYVADLFVLGDNGNYVFKPYSKHDIKVFYFERGGGCANLYMRFNLTTASEDKIRLSKEVEGLGADEAKLAEFAYQVYYKLTEGGPEIQLTNDEANDVYRAYYKDTDRSVPFRDSVDIDGIAYNNVYLLKNGETADITFPLQVGQKLYSYRVVECGVDTGVYSQVDVNGSQVEGTAIAGHDSRRDFDSGHDSIANRAMVAYKNTANPDALHNLTFTKKLFRADGVTPISYSNDQQGFDLRLYLSPETRELAAANIYPYHVLDADGNYCVWNGAAFESLGKSVFDNLTEPEKAQATFLTSPNGAMSQIPADHTVQVRNLSKNSKYMVEERSGEVPDGYEFIKYVKDATDYAGATEFAIEDGDSHIEVHNKKLGRKVRIKKVDQSNTELPLQGAMFDLYVVNGGVQEQTPLISGLTSGTDGLLAKGGATAFDLSAGTYHLVETQAPAGHLLWDEPATIEIVYAEDDPDAVTYNDGTAYARSGEGRSFDSPTSTYTLAVTNTGGGELPHAGGPGVGATYALGTLLIVAGLLTHKRRGQPA